MKKYIAYFRVSTNKQGVDGLGIDAQRNAVTAFVGPDGNLLSSFTEVESGKRSDRPELHKAISLCRRERAILLVAKLDRLARSVSFISSLMDADVEFVCVDNPHANRMTIQILAVVAEHERSAISARTVAALGAAKRRGVRLGNPWLGMDNGQLARQAGAVRKEQAVSRALELSPVLTAIRAAGVRTYQGFADALNARGIKTARGLQWHASTARRLILLAENCRRQE